MTARRACGRAGWLAPRRRVRGPVSAAAVFGSVAAGWVAGGAVRRVSVRTGVSDEEASGPLPGDEFIAHPMVEWTRGVTVRAAPERVWPWLVQMGYGRGGWYTPQWADLFANRWVFGVKHPFPASASRLLPEYQHVAVGDLICDGPDYASYFRVLRVDPQHAVVYRSIRHPRRGSPIDITDPSAAQRAEQQLRDSGTYVDFTWALILNGVPCQRTRLLVRTRANYSPQAIRLLSLPLGLIDATYGVAMLRAIARRAESAGRREHSPRLGNRAAGGAAAAGKVQAVDRGPPGAGRGHVVAVAAHQPPTGEHRPTAASNCFVIRRPAHTVPGHRTLRRPRR